jgi:hypothetical protein
LRSSPILVSMSSFCLSTAHPSVAHSSIYSSLSRHVESGSPNIVSVNEILSEHAVPSRGQIGRLSRHLVWPGELAERLVQAISYANILHPPLVPHAVIHCSSLCASLTATTHASPPGHRALVSLTMQVVVSVSDQWGI